MILLIQQKIDIREGLNSRGRSIEILQIESTSQPETCQLERESDSEG